MRSSRQPLTAETGVEEADFSAHSYELLEKLGCHTLADAARLSVWDILFHPDGLRRIVDEINDKVALAGLRPLSRTQAPTSPPVPAWSFGSLCVLCDDGDAVARVREAMIEAYASIGGRPVYIDIYQDWEAQGFSDVVLVEQESPSWVGVKSERLELAPPARHPLASHLSRRWPVVSMTATHGVAYELCLYRDGTAVQYAAAGRPAEPASQAAPFDFSLLARHARLPIAEAELRAVFGNAEFFGKNAGLSIDGCAAFLERSFDEDVLVGTVFFTVAEPEADSYRVSL